MSTSATGTKRLIDAIFEIDQALGHLEILQMDLKKYPEVDWVRDKIARNISRLESIARSLEKLRPSVL